MSVVFGFADENLLVSRWDNETLRSTFTCFPVILRNFLKRKFVRLFDD